MTQHKIPIRRFESKFTQTATLKELDLEEKIVDCQKRLAVQILKNDLQKKLRKSVAKKQKTYQKSNYINSDCLNSHPSGTPQYKKVRRTHHLPESSRASSYQAKPILKPTAF